MQDQRGDVFAPVPQGRQDKGNHIDAVKQIFTELTGFHAGCEITVGGADEPDVDVNGFRTADPPDFPFLNGAEQLALHRQRHLPDFVQKQCAIVGRLEHAEPLLTCTGKRTFFVAEQFALQ